MRLFVRGLRRSRCVAGQCLINEYLWFSWATFVGGLDWACGGGIEREWEFCTQQRMEAGDVGGWANVGDRTPPPMPLIFPSGHYRPPVVPDYDFAVRTDVPAELSAWFDRYVVVFGVHVFTSHTVDDWAMQHIARVLAKFLVSCRDIAAIWVAFLSSQDAIDIVVDRTRTRTGSLTSPR